MFIHMIILLSYAIAWFKRIRETSTTPPIKQEESIVDTYFDDTTKEYSKDGDRSDTTPEKL